MKGDEELSALMPRLMRTCCGAPAAAWSIGSREACSMRLALGVLAPLWLLSPVGEASGAVSS